jgi:hypothetical protein
MTSRSGVPSAGGATTELLVTGGVAAGAVVMQAVAVSDNRTMEKRRMGSRRRVTGTLGETAQ